MGAHFHRAGFVFGDEPGRVVECAVWVGDSADREFLQDAHDPPPGGMGVPGLCLAARVHRDVRLDAVWEWADHVDYFGIQILPSRGYPAR